MAFNYERNKNGHSNDSMWTSYSDLFLGLSIIFLLLYVSASLRQGTDGIRQHFENQRLAREADDLRQQIKVYETLKQDYLNQQASQSEQENYKMLMDKLSLLREEAKEEKLKLRMQAQENEKKERALNQYQQMIRNIINANLIAKGRIKTRDTMIESQDEIITEKTKEIRGLEAVVAEKSAEIRQGEERIAGLEGDLRKRMRQLKSAYESQTISKKKFREQQQALKLESERKILALKERNERVRLELDRASRELAATASELNETQGQVAQLGQEKSRLEGELKGASERHQAEVRRLQAAFADQNAKDRAAFEAQLEKEKLSGAQRAAREARFKAEADAKAKALQGRIAALDEKYQATKGELARAMENLNARRNLARQIADNFKRSGVKAEVDGKSGDVLLSFDGQYFDTGRADLKPGMKEILEKAMPAYSQSLFHDKKIAEKIQSVEIVGFASPTYKGKYIDPTSLDPENRQAVNYNLDLSYKRARAIFNYVFDKKKLSFKHQETLLPLVKVTGRSFLASQNGEREPAAQGGSAEDFCRKNDCAKLQRVVIKFTLKD